MANDDVNVDEQAEQQVDEAAQALKAERDDLYDRLLRTTADFDNYRKRIDRERREGAEYVAADVIRDILPAVDDLERALLAAKSSDDSADGPSSSSLLRGVELIHKQLLEVLKRRGVEPLVTVGETFDPSWHEAILHEPGTGRPEGEIVGEVRRGYRLGQRLLRPAQVRVAKA
jgi:molecular chaperone GrpE